MTIEHRIEKLEEEVVISPGDPSFTLYVFVGNKPTEKEIDRAKKEVVKRRPDESSYLLYFDEDGIWRE